MKENKCCKRIVLKDKKKNFGDRNSKSKYLRLYNCDWNINYSFFNIASYVYFLTKYEKQKLPGDFTMITEIHVRQHI